MVLLDTRTARGVNAHLEALTAAEELNRQAKRLNARSRPPAGPEAGLRDGLPRPSFQWPPLRGKEHGPRTPEGRESSRKANWKHGLQGRVPEFRYRSYSSRVPITKPFATPHWKQVASPFWKSRFLQQPSDRRDRKNRITMLIGWQRLLARDQTTVNVSVVDHVARVEGVITLKPEEACRWRTRRAWYRARLREKGEIPPGEIKGVKRVR